MCPGLAGPGGTLLDQAPFCEVEAFLELGYPCFQSGSELRVLLTRSVEDSLIRRVRQIAEPKPHPCPTERSCRHDHKCHYGPDEANICGVHVGSSSLLDGPKGLWRHRRVMLRNVAVERPVGSSRDPGNVGSRPPWCLGTKGVSHTSLSHDEAKRFGEMAVRQLPHPGGPGRDEASERAR